MDALGVDLSGLLTQIVSFSVLFAVLYLILYKPVLQMLDRRADKIKGKLRNCPREPMTRLPAHSKKCQLKWIKLVLRAKR